VNLYTRIAAGLELQHGQEANRSGLRTRFEWAFAGNRQSVSLVAPFLEYEPSNVFGIGDVTARWTGVLRRAGSGPGALAVAAEVTAPTGRIENGLGADRWVIAPSVTAGFGLSENISFFPEIQYRYQSERSDPALTDSLGMPDSTAIAVRDSLLGPNEVEHGWLLRLTVPVRITGHTTLRLAPAYAVNDARSPDPDQWRFEAELFGMVGRRFLVGASFRHDFKSDLEFYNAYLEYYF
jgi:hypothetical protein